MKYPSKEIIAIFGLTVLGVVFANFGVSERILYGVVTGIAGVAGFRLGCGYAKDKFFHKGVAVEGDGSLLLQETHLDNMLSFRCFLTCRTLVDPRFFVGLVELPAGTRTLRCHYHICRNLNRFKRRR